MNTANPQLEGLYLAVAAINRLMVDKGLVSAEELGQALDTARQQALRDDKGEVSDSHKKAVLFPIHFLQLANEGVVDLQSLTFSDIAREVGRRT